MREGREGHVEERIVGGPHGLIVPNKQGLEARQALQKQVDRSRQPAGDADRK
jgi:hypothetical protein